MSGLDNYPDPSKLSEEILGLLERAGISTEINDAICKLVEKGERELKASGANYEPKGKLIGRICPNCTCKLSVEIGNLCTYSEPENPTIIYCEHCGFEQEPTDEDWKKIQEPTDEGSEKIQELTDEDWVEI